MARLSRMIVAVALVVTACSTTTSGIPPVPTIAPAPTREPATIKLAIADAKLSIGAADTGKKEPYDVKALNGSAKYAVYKFDGVFNVIGSASGDVQVKLDPRAPWTVIVAKGLSSLSVDMRAGTLRALTLEQGVSSVDLSAGAPRTNVPIAMGSGVSKFALHVPDATAVTVRCRSGAGSVTLFGTKHTGVAAGDSFSAGRGTKRYVLDFRAGVSSVTVD